MKRIFQNKIMRKNRQFSCLGMRLFVSLFQLFNGIVRVHLGSC